MAIVKSPFFEPVFLSYAELGVEFFPRRCVALLLFMEDYATENSQDSLRDRIVVSHKVYSNRRRDAPIRDRISLALITLERSVVIPPATEREYRVCDVVIFAVPWLQRRDKFRCANRKEPPV